MINYERPDYFQGCHHFWDVCNLGCVMYGASRIFAVDELSVLILMARVLHFTVMPSKVGLAYLFEN